MSPTEPTRTPEINDRWRRTPGFIVLAGMFLLCIQGFTCEDGAGGGVVDVVESRNLYDDLHGRPHSSAMSGDNDHGNFGKPPGTPGFPPTTKTPSGFVDAVTVDGGATHSVAVTTDRKVKTSGKNDFGQLGNGTTTSSDAPGEVASIANAVQAEAGWFHTLVLTAPPPGLRGRFFGGGAKVYAFGDNFYGQLGDGGVLAMSSTPVEVPIVGDPVSIHAGQWDTNFVILADGTVQGWGVNANGEIGDGSDVNRPSPTVVPGLNTVVDVACGGQHTLFLLADGTVRATGMNTFGQLGLGISDPKVFVPTVIPNLSGVVSIAAGAEHSVAVTQDGRVYAWGRNFEGQLGVSTPSSSNVPVLVPGLALASQAQCGLNFTLVRLFDGTARTFGDNAMGQLAIGDTTNRFVPVEPLPASARIGLLAAGHHFSIFHELNGSVIRFALDRQGVVPFVGEIQAIPAEVMPSGGGSVYTTTIHAYSADGVSFEGREPYPVNLATPASVRIKRHGTFLSKLVVLPVPVGDEDVDLGTILLRNGDVNGDNSVGIPDFIQLRNAFGSTVGGPTWNPNADLNKDGNVSIADFVIFRASFGAAGE